MGTNHDGGYIKGVHGLIASQAQLQPRHEAVRHGARVLSFGELDASSSVLARELQRRNIKPNDVVGLHGPRSLEAIVGMLAILKSGAAYVPLDLTHPPARIADIVRDARLTHVVDSDREDAGRPPWAAGVEWIPAALDRGPSSEPLRVPVAPDSIAMVLYTSGSSGRPKGVVLSHRALAARTGTWHAHGVQCQISSLSTVAHIGDLLTPLANGFGILMLDDNTVRDASALARAIQVHHIRRMRFVPSQLRAVLSDPAVVAHLDGVEELIVSGEMVTRALVADTKRALPKARIVNAYGTTETAGMVCAGEIESGARVTIGAPSADWDVHIMDEHLREAVPGALGELCLSGEQLASRYLHDAALTAERFVASPFNDRRMYRTGDLARRLPDGEIELLGRADGQVKIRGHRVTVGDIERAFDDDEWVEHVAVVPDDMGALRAHVVLAAGPSGDVLSLRHRLATRLPAHMIPAQIVILERLPLLPGGKVDRVQLQAHGRNQLTSPCRPSPSLSAGGDAVGDVVADIWNTVFDAIGLPVDGDFFDSGGDSLMATRILARINEQFSLDVSLDEFLAHPTAAQLGALVTQRLAEAPGAGTA